MYVNICIYMHTYISIYIKFLDYKVGDIKTLKSDSINQK